MQSLTYQSEIIVVGGGLAGVVTALELLDHGKKVLLIDRDEAGNFGGLANWAFGGMFFVNSKHQQRVGIKDSYELALHDWLSAAEFSEEDHWPRRWAKHFIHHSTETGYHWLREKGVNFFPAIHWVERGLYQPGNSVPRFHLTWGTGYGLVQTLIGHLNKHPKRDQLQLLFGHRVHEILVENQQVKGVSGIQEKEGTAFTARAEVVVVATGGINGSIEKVKANWYQPWGTPPEVILNGAHPYAIGDLHLATERINGQVTHLDRQWNYAAGVHHPEARHEYHGLSLIPCKSALWMNYRGERIGPMPLVTAYDTRYLVEAICKEQKKYSWQILNWKIAVKEMAISGSEHNPAIRDKKLFAFLKSVLFGNKKQVQELVEHCPDFVVANSLEELVEKMNALTGENDVQLERMREDIHRYDTQIDRGGKYFNDEQLRRIAHVRRYLGDRLRTSKFQKIDDPKARPLIAIREFILSRKSLGGIQTDLECRVLSQPTGQEQVPIPGLYAVGEAAGFGGGGVHGLRSLEGTFLSGCVITGRLAAKHIAGKKV